MKKLILTTIVATALSGCAGLKQASKQNYDDTYYAINEKRPDAAVTTFSNRSENKDSRVTTQKRTASSQYNGRYSSRFNRMGNTCNQGFYGQPNYNMYGYGNPYNSFYDPYNNFGYGLGWQMSPYLSMGWGMNPYSNYGYFNSPGYYYRMGYYQGANNNNYFNNNNFSNNNNSGSSKPKGLYMRRNTSNTSLPSNSSGGTVYRPGSSSIQNGTSGTTRTSINSSNGTSSSPSNPGNTSGNTSSTRGGTISSGNSSSNSSSSGSIFSGSSTRGSGSSGTSGGSSGGGSRGGSGSSGGSSGKRR